MKMTVSGNPYTHEEHSRISYGKKDLLYGYACCTWCGQIKHRVYSYDGKAGLYCNKDCYQADFKFGVSNFPFNR